MSINENDRQSLIRHRIKEAEETVEDVRILKENERYRAAVNRIYYGMFYSLLALGLLHQFETSKHTQLIGWFNKNFIHQGLIETQYGKYINKAYNNRTKGDYDIHTEFDKETVDEMFSEMQAFISRIKQYLNIK